MNKDKEPLMSFNEWESLNPQLCDLIPEYAKYHTEWHLNNVKEVVCEEVRFCNKDEFDYDYDHATISKQSITNAIKNYIKENLK